MKNTFFKIKHWLKMLFIWTASVIDWVRLYPLMTYLTRKFSGWKLKLLLFLIQLLRSIIFVIIFFTCVKGCFDYNRKHQFADNKILENITTVPFPEVKIVDYNKGRFTLRGGYFDKLTLEMEEELSESLYCRIDSIISNQDEDSMGGWSKSDDGYYRFSTIWGGLIPAPDGVSGGDMDFSLSIKKGSKIVTLNYGAW